MKSAFLPILLALTVSGCINEGSGKSSGSGSTTPATSYPLAQAMQTLQAAGFPASSGAVSGTSTTNGVPSSITGNYTALELASFAGGTFASQAALQQSNSLVATVGSSPIVNLGLSSINFFTTTGVPLGQTWNGTYCVVTSSTPYPASVTVGQTGEVSVQSCYTDSTMSTLLGTTTLGYTVNSTTSTSATAPAILTISFALLNTSNQMVAQIETSFQISTSGNLTFDDLAINETVAGTLYQVTSSQ